MSFIHLWHFIFLLSHQVEKEGQKFPSFCKQNLKILLNNTGDLRNIIAQSAGAVEYTDCTSAEG